MASSWPWGYWLPGGSRSLARGRPGLTSKRIMLGIGAAAALGVLYAVDPAGSRLIPPCPFHALTSLYCPGCGSLRALHRLLHGDVRGALGFNPILALVLPFTLAMSAEEILRLARSSGRPSFFSSPLWGKAVLFLILVYWMARNLPWLPFTLLAPR